MSINAWFFYSGKQKRNCYIVAFSWMCKNKYRFSSSQQNWFSKQEKVVILAIKVWFGEKFLGRFNEDRKPTCIETTLLMLPELQVCYRLGRSKKEFISLWHSLLFKMERAALGANNQISGKGEWERPWTKVTS